MIRFRHNWASEVVVRTSYETDVSISDFTEAEERKSLKENPSRSIEIRIDNFDIGDVGDFLASLAKASKEPTLVPLYSDVSYLKDPIVPGAQFLNCATSYRRFRADRQILIASGRGTEYAQFDVVSCFVVSQDQLILTPNQLPTKHFPAGSEVIPLLTSKLLLESEISFATDSIAFSELEFEEVIDQTTQIGRTALSLPTGSPTHNGLPVLFPYIQWGEGVSIEIVRRGREVRIGRSSFTRTSGQVPHLVISLTIAGRTRADVWPIIQLFDVVKGRTFPFWMTLPIGVAKANTQVSSLILIQKPEAEAPADFGSILRNIAVVNPDGATEFFGVLEFQDHGSIWAIQLDRNVPVGFPINSKSQIHLAVLCRFDSDELIETWRTSEVCEIEISCRELLDEAPSDLAPDPIGLVPQRVSKFGMQVCYTQNPELRMSKHSLQVIYKQLQTAAPQVTKATLQVIYPS